MTELSDKLKAGAARYRAVIDAAVAEGARIKQAREAAETLLSTPAPPPPSVPNPPAKT